MNKQSNLVGRYRQLNKILIHFKEVLTSREEICLGNFISYQWNLRAKTTQFLVNLLDPSNSYACHWD